MNNWMEFHPVITKADLGWSEELVKDLGDACSHIYVADLLGSPGEQSSQRSSCDWHSQHNKQQQWPMRKKYL